MFSRLTTPVCFPTSTIYNENSPGTISNSNNLPTEEGHELSPSVSSTTFPIRNEKESEQSLTNLENEHNERDSNYNDFQSVLENLPESMVE